MKKWSNALLGVWAGGSTVVYFLIFYLVSPRLMLNAWVAWSSLLIYLAFMALAVRRQQAATAGRLPFRTALQAAFTVFVVANAVYYLFYYLLFNIFDPGLLALQREVMLENAEKYAGLLGGDNAAEMQRRLRTENIEVTSPSLLLSYAWGLLGGFVLALGVAKSLERRKSEE